MFSRAAAVFVNSLSKLSVLLAVSKIQKGGKNTMCLQVVCYPTCVTFLLSPQHLEWFAERWPPQYGACPDDSESFAGHYLNPR